MKFSLDRFISTRSWRGTRGVSSVCIVRMTLRSCRIMHQGGRGGIHVGRQEHRRAIDARRRFRLQLARQPVKTNLILARFAAQQAVAAQPCPHHTGKQRGDGERHPPAVQDLKHVGREEGLLDERQRQHQGQSLP
jgi:hypothetical protein